MKSRESFGQVDGVNGSCEALNLKKSAEAPYSPSREVIRDGEGGLGQGKVFSQRRRWIFTFHEHFLLTVTFGRLQWSSGSQ